MRGGEGRDRGEGVRADMRRTLSAGGFNFLIDRFCGGRGAGARCGGAGGGRGGGRSNNNLGDEGVKYVAMVLPSLTKLQTLNLT